MGLPRSRLPPADPLSGTVSVPHPHTLRRLLVQLDGDALDRAIGSFLTARAAPAGPGLRAIAVDGKALRGSRTHVTGHVTLLAAMDHTGHVLAQRQATDKSNEIPAFRPLLDSVDLTGTVITADALHTQHAHGTYLRERGAHYIAQVKANHPGLFDRVRRLPWRETGGSPVSKNTPRSVCGRCRAQDRIAGSAPSATAASHSVSCFVFERL